MDTIQPHLSGLNEIPMIMLYILLRWISELMSHSLFGIQLDVMHVEEVTHSCSTLELESITPLCDDLAKGI